MVAAELRLSPFGRRTRSLLVAPARFGRPRDRASGRDLGARARRRVRGRGRGRRSRGPHCELAAAHAEGGQEATAAPMNRRTCRRGVVGCAPRTSAAITTINCARSRSAISTRVTPTSHAMPSRAGHCWRLSAAPALRPTAACAHRCMAPPQPAVLPSRPFPAWMRRASPPGPAPGETMRDPLTPPSDYLDHAAARRIVGGVLLTMLLAALDQVMVATALPTIAASLGDVDNMSWVVTANLLCATEATPLYGKLSDIHGRRTMMLIAIGVYAAGSLACALAPSMLTLILGRALQGLGGGGLMPLVQTIVGDVAS